VSVKGLEVFGDEYEEEVDTGYKPGTLDIPLTIGKIKNITVLYFKLINPLYLSQVT
jgi:hypothetical protein